MSNGAWHSKCYHASAGAIPLLKSLLAFPGVSMGKDEGWAAAAPGKSAGGADW